jgi:signal transduction histidine kinase
MHDVAVRELFDRVHRTFSALAEKQDITFEVVLDENAPETVPGDADRLRDQVLGNLISNAFKFTPTNGAVLVRGWEENGWLCICVRDTGSGIPEEQQPHIFDKFYQVGGQARSKGAGLGLTIAYEVVQGHGGELTVESNPGEGTTFQIRLPLTREQAVYARTQLERRVDDRAAAAAAESTVES